MFDRILDGDIEALAKVSRSAPELGEILLPLLSLKGQSSAFLRNNKELLCRALPEIRSSLDDFLKTITILDDLDIKYQINIASGAGFEYYTGIIFQLFIGGEKIGGGGRYDALISSMGGGDVPASGFAIYLDRLIKLVKPESLLPPSIKRVLVKGSDAKQVFEVANALRQAGYIAELDLDGKTAEWTLEVKDGGALTLLEKVKSKRTDARSVAEVIKLLEAKGAA